MCYEEEGPNVSRAKFCTFCAFSDIHMFRLVSSSARTQPKLALRTHVRTVPRVAIPQIRMYSAAHKLSYDEVQQRVLEVVKNFDKVDAEKVSPVANFQKDLGIDSLDAVELVMALEDEFVIEIPDVEAEKIQSCADAINYISTHPEAK